MSVTETAASARGTTAGVDWTKDDYAVCVVDGDGEPVQRVTLPYTTAGLRRLVELLDHHRVEAVGIERVTARSSTPCWPPTASCT